MNEEEVLLTWNMLGVIFVEDQTDLNTVMDILNKNDVSDYVVRPTKAGWTISRD